ncbi:hypothetical protein [Flagellimonas sp.]|uniref:hypothetical protein n=1 Tax=Flagellimonas sp. TaxID=2058762 RepID=UPI003B5148DD
MKLLENYLLKLLAGSISKSEFENELYQEHIVAKMEADEFIENLININYNDNYWRVELENLAMEHFGEETLLLNSIKYKCLQILESSDKNIIFNKNRELAKENVNYNYQHKWLMKFYRLDDELDLTRSGYGHLTEDQVAKEIKSEARMFLNHLENKE